MSNKRVLIFSLAYFPLVGGAEVAIKEITDRLRDYQFDMITLRFSPKDSEFEPMGNIHVYRIGGSKNLFPFKAFLLARKLHDKREYTHVWAMMANWAGFAALFFKMAFPKVRYVLTLQEGDPISYIKRRVLLVYPLFKKIFTHADIVQAISVYLGRWAKEMGYKGRVEVIPNGVDFNKFENKSPKPAHGDTFLITTSRLVEKNGIGDVISALALLPENVKFEVLGTGPLEAKLKKQVEKLKLEKRVVFLGLVDQKKIPMHLHAAHIFIRPSLSEGMGNSFIEAMAAGLPVIATEVGGIPDFLRDPDKSPHKAPTGLYVPVRSPEAIAKAVKRLMKDNRLRETLVVNAKRLVRDRYDWNLIAEAMRRQVFDTKR
jgi:glycosyltransferase involved in cell wall biosynthesis